VKCLSIHVTQRPRRPVAAGSAAPGTDCTARDAGDLHARKVGALPHVLAVAATAAVITALLAACTDTPPLPLAASVTQSSQATGGVALGATRSCALQPATEGAGYLLAQSAGATWSSVGPDPVAVALKNHDDPKFSAAFFNGLSKSAIQKLSEGMLKMDGTDKPKPLHPEIWAAFISSLDACLISPAFAYAFVTTRNPGTTLNSDYQSMVGGSVNGGTDPNTSRGLLLPLSASQVLEGLTNNPGVVSVDNNRLIDINWYTVVAADALSTGIGSLLPGEPGAQFVPEVAETPATVAAEGSGHQIANALTGAIRKDAQDNEPKAPAGDADALHAYLAWAVREDLLQYALALPVSHMAEMGVLGREAGYAFEKSLLLAPWGLRGALAQTAIDVFTADATPSDASIGVLRSLFVYSVGELADGFGLVVTLTDAAFQSVLDGPAFQAGGDVLCAAQVSQQVDSPYAIENMLLTILQQTGRLDYVPNRVGAQPTPVPTRTPRLSISDVYSNLDVHFVNAAGAHSVTKASALLDEMRALWSKAINGTSPSGPPRIPAQFVGCLSRTNTVPMPSGPTKLITFQPWVPYAPTGNSGPMPGAVLTKATGTCDGGSPHDPGRDSAFRCTSTDPNVRADPCFANFNSGDPGSSLLCSTDPTTMSLVELDQAGGQLPTSKANTEDPNAPPWFLVLSDGLKCHMVLGTNTQYLPYDCSGGTSTTAPDRSTPAWTVREGKNIGPNSRPSSPPVEVIAAYR
jgi:hypothetical protein